MRALPVLFVLATTPATLAFPALAQPAQQPDALTEMARKRFEEGVTLFDKGEYERAQAAFLQAWALKKHPAVLLNLAQSELGAGNHVQAARHFAQYLRDYPDTPESQQKAARDGLQEARKHTGQLDIAVGVEGAEIVVDGEVVGRSPLVGPVDVTPGAHQIEARLPGAAPVSKQTTVAQGGVAEVRFELGTAEAAPAPTPAAPGAAPTSPAAPQPVEPAPDEPGGRKSFIGWATSEPVAWATLGATGAGLGLGVTFGILANSAGSDADSIAVQITAVAQRDPGMTNYEGLDRRANPCADPIPVTNQTDYRPSCQQLGDTLDTRDSRRTWMWVGFGVAAAGAVGTGVAYYLQSDPGVDTAAEEPKGFTTVAPVWTPEMTGLGVAGSF